MNFTTTQIEEYNNKGFVILPNLFTKNEIKSLTNEIDPFISNYPSHVVYEANKKYVRSLSGIHLKSHVYAHLSRQTRLIEPIKQLLNDDVYLHQTQLPMKPAFGGEHFPWHQDFVYNHEQDGIPLPKMVGVVVFLDDFHEFNGPLWVIPGSHSEGIIDTPEKLPEKHEDYDWKKETSTDFTLTPDEQTITKWIEKKGIVSLKGDAGTVLFFHLNLLHASLPNISPYQRRAIIMRYNSINNLPTRNNKSRVAHLSNPEQKAIVASDQFYA